MTQFGRVIRVLLLMGCVLAGGCRREREPHVITRKGVIKSVDLKNKTALIVTDNKLGNKLDITGQFTETTAVTINGQPAQLGDIRTGDNVEVSAIRKGKGLEMDFVATKVVVSRPVSTQPKS